MKKFLGFLLVIMTLYTQSIASTLVSGLEADPMVGRDWKSRVLAEFDVEGVSGMILQPIRNGSHTVLCRYNDGDELAAYATICLQEDDDEEDLVLGYSFIDADNDSQFDKATLEILSDRLQEILVSSLPDDEGDDEGSEGGTVES